jgi:hypothetical protein
MAYHPVTPGLLSSGFRVFYTIPQGDEIDITPTTIRNLYPWNGIVALNLTLVIESGVTIGSTTTDKPALKISGFRNRDKIVLINNGNIFGKGGARGLGASPGSTDTACESFAGSRTSPGAGGNGSPGGDALVLQSNIFLINNGVIGGGSGGGGGNGANSLIRNTRNTFSYTYRILYCNGGSNQNHVCQNPNNVNYSCTYSGRWERKSFNSNDGCKPKVFRHRFKNYTNQSEPIAAANCSGYFNATFYTFSGHGEAGEDGGGATGANGAFNATGGGTGGSPGYSILGVNFLKPNSILGTRRGL